MRSTGCFWSFSSKVSLFYPPVSSSDSFFVFGIEKNPVLSYLCRVNCSLSRWRWATQHLPWTLRSKPAEDAGLNSKARRSWVGRVCRKGQQRCRWMHSDWEWLSGCIFASPPSICSSCQGFRNYSGTASALLTMLARLSILSHGSRCDLFIQSLTVANCCSGGSSEHYISYDVHIWNRCRR